jgi:CheY-like chemotaxis protein/predicted regulator of Ras-like GTPase activity (Roadblock/LC7/MglB family)
MNQKSPSKRVLIVDDESTVTTILATGLENLGQGYIIETAKSGEEALKCLYQAEYALVITDYIMPGMSGIKLAKQIRESFPETQIMLMTAFSTNGLREAAAKLMLDGYIEKPFRLDKIREIVKNAVERTTEGEDAFRKGERQLSHPVRAHLEALHADTNARCVLLLSDGGFPIEVVGKVEDLDISTISALVAANFIAAAELARLLGNNSVFKSSHHEGPDYNIYAHDVNGDCFLAIISGVESKAGIVRFYLQKTLTVITPLLDADEPTEKLDSAVLSAIDDEMDRLFDL